MVLMNNEQCLQYFLAAKTDCVITLCYRKNIYKMVLEGQVERLAIHFCS